MAFTRSWDETAPTDVTNANLLGLDIRQFKQDIRERIDSAFGTSGGSSLTTADPYRGIRMTVGNEIVPTSAATALDAGTAIYATATAGVTAKFVAIGTNGQSFVGYRYNTSSAAPSAVLNTNQLSAFYGGGYDGTAWNLVAGMAINATENWTNSAHGTQLVLFNGLKGTTTINSALTLDTIVGGHFATFGGQVIANNTQVFGASAPAIVAFTAAGFIVGINIQRQADAMARVAIKEDGIYFGPGGASALDATLTRTGVGTLSMNGNLTLSSAAAVLNFSDAGGGQSIQIAANTKITAVEAGTGIIGVGTGVSSAILFTWFPGGRFYGISFSDVGGVRNLALSAGGTNGMNIDGGIGGANDTAISIYDITAATVKRVSRGAADSGGAGFRLLRIAN